jgi:virginiamycin A acetyltransferase
MRSSFAVRAGEYTSVTYAQFNQSLLLRAAMRVAGALTWPVIVPLALLSRLSDDVFFTCSQLVALAPFLFGTIMRNEFYRMTLRSFGANVMIGFGTVFQHRDVSVGNNVTIGMYNSIHFCDIGSYVLIGDGCRLLSGAYYHDFSQTDRPMALQGGRLTRISIGDDSWIGVNAVVMRDIGSGAVVGAGSVVMSPIKPLSVVAGNPARPIAVRGDTKLG